jgi:branched-chain amino acid transport system substrate-binding protein
MRSSRRSFLKAALASGVGHGAFIGLAKDLLAAPATGAPIRLGLQVDLTGGFASWGYWHDKATRKAVEYVNANGGIAGRPVELIIEDSESNPPTGARKFRSLVQRSNVDFVIGAVHSGVNLATVPIAKELKTVYIPHGMADEMTGTMGNRYVFRVNSDTYSQAAAGAEWANTNLGKKWTFLFADFGWGWSHYKDHKAVLENLGAQVNEPIAVPLDAKDLLPYLAKVPSNTEQLYSIFFGSQSVAYYTQSKSMGLDKRMHRYSVLCTHEAICPKDIGDASEGIHLLEYHPRMLKYKETPFNAKVREIMEVDPIDGRERGSNRVLASSHYWAYWESLFFIKKAIEKSGWKAKKDTPDFIRALEGMEVEESIEHPQGRKYIRPQDHKAVIDFYMSQIQKGEINVKKSIAGKMVEQYYPPKVDFTKEQIS